MSTDQRNSLRIFLSSTAIDMLDHRQKVTDALLRLDNLPVRMEAFGAIPNSPVDVCKLKVSESNALIVMAAHRYGWVPTVEEGGDGKMSITWIEVETAIDNHIPVFAFIVEDKYGWTQPKEQDLITETTDEKKIAGIVRNVQSLKEFKNFLESKAHITRDKFTTPEDLALKVATSLPNWLSNDASFKKNIAPKRPAYILRIVHFLQPAPHFRGRVALLDELMQWWKEPVTPDRVRSLVAIGGTGKTAVAERFLNGISKEQLRGSVLVWSFYDDPNMDAFLKEACIVFTGEEPEGVGGRLEKLQRALAAENIQHLIVLDGLERVQSEGKGSGHAKGDLEDHRLKNLLRSIAGGLGNTRTLITSRFKLNDLTEWEGAGYKSYSLDVLDKETAIEVLKAWKIKGDDENLAQIAASVGNHALSVSVLGSYLNHYADCNPDGVKEFKLDEASADDSQAARLGRVLGGYAKNLPVPERDLIVRLSVFPNGITVELLGYLIDAGSVIAGALIGADQNKLLSIAEKLKKQGLVYSYKKEDTIIYTAHPFLREYFRKLLGVKPEDIHEVVRNKLAIGLDTKPENKPSDTGILDKYEQLIQYSILSGHYQEAFNLYWNSMGGGGGNVHLYHTVGDYGRIVRIISLFSDDGTPQALTNNLSEDDKALLLGTWGLADSALGDLKSAVSTFYLSYEIRKKAKSWINLAVTLQSIAIIRLSGSVFPSSNKLLEEAADYLKENTSYDDHSRSSRKNNFAYLGYTSHCVGNILAATDYFAAATELEGVPLYALNGFYEIDHLLSIGDKEKAFLRTKESLTVCEDNQWPKYTNQCYYLLGLLSLPESIAIAREHLQKLREWTEKSGEMETIIYSHILAAEIAFCSKDYPAALFEADRGYRQAESCGYGKFAIDLLLKLSKIHLAIPDYKAALGFAREAFERSAHPDCSYAWGEADGLHLCGVCHKGLGEYELARQRLEAALKLRRKIQHPEAGETGKLIEELPNSPAV